MNFENSFRGFKIGDSSTMEYSSLTAQSSLGTKLEVSKNDLGNVLEKEGSINLADYARYAFADINMPPSHRKYLDSFRNLNILQKEEQKTFRIPILKGMDIEQVLKNESVGMEKVVGYEVILGDDEWDVLKIKHLRNTYSIGNGKGDRKEKGIRIDLDNIIGERDPINTLFGVDEKDHKENDILYVVISLMRHYGQSVVGLDAEGWVNKLLNNKGNCIDHTLFKLIVLQLYPRYRDIRNLTPIGYTGNHIMDGGKGTAQHYGLAYINKKGGLEVMPAGGPQFDIKSSIEQWDALNQGDLESTRWDRELRAQILSMIRATRKYFPDEARELLKQLGYTSHSTSSSLPST